MNQTCLLCPSPNKQGICRQEGALGTEARSLGRTIFRLQFSKVSEKFDKILGVRIILPNEILSYY